MKQMWKGSGPPRTVFLPVRALTGVMSVSLMRRVSCDGLYLYPFFSAQKTVKREVCGVTGLQM